MDKIILKKVGGVMIGGFTALHPIVSFSYFVLLFIGTMSFENPLYTGAFFVFAIGVSVDLDGGTTLARRYKLYGVMALLIWLMNTFFTSRGGTVLWYMGNRPVTLESTLYGMLFATRLVTVLLIFDAYNLVISAEKFLYLFGRIVPRLAFIVTITMRFMPLFTRRIEEITAVQTTLGYYGLDKSWKQKLLERMETLYILVSWTLEESLENATSMRARGYGMTRRTSGVTYALTRREIWVSIMLVVWCIAMGWSMYKGYGRYDVYEDWRGIWRHVKMDQLLVLCLGMSVPLLIDGRERLRWLVIGLRD
ncbi:MAG: energy-coupling factor transporter transmembrane component T [Cellulosilyticaceae bacterium]